MVYKTLDIRRQMTVMGESWKTNKVNTRSTPRRPWVPRSWVREGELRNSPVSCKLKRQVKIWGDPKWLESSRNEFQRRELQRGKSSFSAGPHEYNRVLINTGMSGNCPRPGKESNEEIRGTGLRVNTGPRILHVPTTWTKTASKFTEFGRYQKNLRSLGDSVLD